MAESEVTRVIRQQRQAVADNERDTLKRLARLWVPSYRYLQQQVDDLLAVIKAQQDEGKEVWIGYIHSLERYQRMMDQAKQMIRKYNKAAAGQIRGTEAEMEDLGHENAKQLVSMAEPDDPMWTRVNKRETRIAAAMAAEDAPLDRLLDKSFGQMKEGMESALITGISTGQGSSWIAQQMMDAAQIPEQRALLIARTEVNRAYRQSNWEQMRSSRAIRGYRRMCYKPTACFACLMLDGEFYSVDEEPTDHPNGKCSFVPVTRHFDPINSPDWQSGSDWFLEQDEETQHKLMGPGRFDLWKSGGVDPRAMVYIKPNDIWGGSPAVRRLEELKTISVSKNYPSSGTVYPKDTQREPIDDTERFAILNNKIYKEYGVELSDDVMLLDYENVEKSLSGVVEVLDKIPEMKKVFKGFIATDRNSLMSTFNNGTIGFSRKFFSPDTKSALSAEIERVITEGLGIKNFSAKSIGYHEAGHLIELLLCHKQAGNEDEAIALYNSQAISENFVKSAIESLGFEYNKNTFIELSGQISTRALVDTGELFAECVADYMTNKELANDLSIALWKLIGG